MGAVIRIVLADLYPLTRLGMRLVLDRMPRMRILAEVADGDTAVLACQSYHPDLLILDPELPGPPPEVLIQRLHDNSCASAYPLHRPLPRIVLWTAAPTAPTLPPWLTTGIAASVGKDAPPEVLVATIERVAQGGTYGSTGGDEVVSQIPRYQLPATADVEFTCREQQVLRLLLLGWSNAHIATALHLTDQTVRNHMRHIYGKLGVHTRAAAIVSARQRGLE
jgi:DNA-binding NarL/FixJ family response regulator